MGRPWLVLAAVVLTGVVAAAPAAGTPTQTPKRGGSVVYGFIEPACLNVLVTNCGLIPFEFPGVVLKGAFKGAPDNTFRPDLVSNVEFTTAPPFTLTYHIRPGAHWSDGVPITAKDFVFTHRAFVASAARSSDTTFADDVATVRSVRGLDAKTVKVVLRTRFAGWRNLFSVVLPAHALAGADLAAIWTDRIDNPKTGDPIGSGPFLVGRWERGRQLTLVRNPRYWGPHPAYLDRILLKTVGFPDGLEDGAVDILWQSVRRQEDFHQYPGYSRVFRSGKVFQHLEIRVGEGGDPALKSKLVRRALAYGIDRIGVVRELFGKLDPKRPALDSNVFLVQSPFYEPNWRTYRYRPDEARRLLGRAGCRAGADGVFNCAGERLSFRLFTTAGDALRELTAQLVQRQLRRAGIEVELVFAPASVLYGQILPSGEYDLSLFGYGYSPDPIGRDDLFGCEGSANWTGYCQRLVTRDLDQADRILDQDQRARALNRADVQMARDVPVIPLFQSFVVAYVRSNIRGFGISYYSDFWKAEDWWLAEKH